MTSSSRTPGGQQHTPGPWHVHAPSPQLPFYVGTDPKDHLGGEVAVLYGKDSGPDASLIAAAPDLLAALEQMVSYDMGCRCSVRERDSGHHVDCHVPEFHALQDIARAATTKARGQ